MAVLPLFALATALATMGAEDSAPTVFSAIDRCITIMSTGKGDPDLFLAAGWTKAEQEAGELDSSRAIMRLEDPDTDDFVIFSEFPSNLECGVHSASLRDEGTRTRLIARLGGRTVPVGKDATGIWISEPSLLVIMPDVRDDQTPMVVATYSLNQGDR